MSSSTGMIASELPDRIGLFPLDGGLLLPSGRLPLQVFESRYRNLINDVMSTSHRLVGIIQPADGVAGGKELHRFGCAGRVMSYTEVSDELYMIILTGSCRFKVVEELDKRNGYRVARTDWSMFVDDLETSGSSTASVDRDMLKKHLKDYLDKKGLAADWEVFGKVPDEELVTSLAMICPFTPKEKQGLLETRSKDKLTERLINLLRIGGANSPSTSTLH